MKRQYYKGTALDYKARDYDNEYSLREYCKKYCKDSKIMSCCTNSSTIPSEEEYEYIEINKEKSCFDYFCYLFY